MSSCATIIRFCARLAEGEAVIRIAEILHLSPKTVSVYRGRMLEKMGFKNNAEAVHYAIAHSLIDLTDAKN